MGFAEVLPNRVSILAETAERAEQRLNRSYPKVECARAQRALARAATRLEAAGRTDWTRRQPD